MPPRLAPDLAVEVLSPTDRARDMQAKAALYQEAGVPLIWVVDPQAQTVLVLALGQSPVILTVADTLDGGEISLQNGEFVMESGYRNALTLSLLGGNELDDGTENNPNTWWGNLLTGTSKAQKYISEFQNLIRSLPLTTKNLVLAEKAAERDLAWLMDEKIADDVNVSIKAIDLKKIDVQIKIQKNGDVIADENFITDWENV